MITSNLLRKLYDHKGDYYILVRADGIILVEEPTAQTPPRDPKEAILRLFMNVQDASRYKERRSTDSRIMKTTLIGLWSLLERINTLSMSSFGCPVAVEVSTVLESGRVVDLDTFHSKFALQS